MKITKKLRDVTPEEYNEYSNRNCNRTKCKDCIFYQSNCSVEERGGGWIFNKDLYSDKFLDQTIEVEVPDILDKEEKEYLSAVIKPFRDRVIYIAKVVVSNKEFAISIKSSIDFNEKGKSIACETNNLPRFKYSDEMYKGMEDNRPYKLEELGLWHIEN